jgi:cell wall-associated NlpC family hydrolase
VNEAEGRARVVEIARSWLGTPYRHAARVKGAGVDCAQILVAVYHEAGLIPDLQISTYSAQWHMHRSEERYLNIVLAHAHEIEGPPKPGDVVLWKFARTFSHGAIVTAWPQVIHSFLDREVVLEDAEKAQWLLFVGEGDGRPRPRKFLSYWS